MCQPGVGWPWLERGFTQVLVVTITVWQAREAGAPLERAERPMLEPAAGELVLEVLHCGLCHSDLSMLDNDWGLSAYPLVPGHEVVGRVVRVGEGVDPGVIGELRGLGWISGSCMHCALCLSGTRQPYLITRQPDEDGGVLRAAQHPPAGGAPADGSAQ